MVMPLEHTKIHNAGLAHEVTELVKERMSCAAIARYIALRYPDVETGITQYDVQNFKNRYVRKEEILPPAAIREELEKRSAVVDVVSLRANLITLQVERIERMYDNEKQMAFVMALTGKSNLCREMLTLNELLDAHKRDLFDLGILGPAISTPPGVGVSAFQQNVISGVELERAMIAGGMDARQARLAIARALYGPERLGEGKPPDVREAPPGEQGAT